MSGAPEPPVPVGVIRDAVRLAVAASSIRAVASAVKVNHGTIVNFLAGAKPHPSTLRKFTRWYVQQSAEQNQDEASARAAIEVLVSGYAPGRREEVRRQLLDVMREGYRAAGTDPPEWLKG